MSVRSICDIEEDSEESRPVIVKSSRPSVNLHPLVVEGCKGCQYQKPNDVQLQILPHVTNNSYNNVVICAPARTGKTTGTIIGILESFVRLLSDHSLAVILCPTYDIADLTYSHCLKLSKFCKDIAVYFVAKGKTLTKDRPKMKEILVGTPDKIFECSRSSVIKLKEVSFLVIDDADCLSNPKKFLIDCSQMFEKLSPKCLTVLCAVSLTNPIKEFIKKYIYHPEEVTVDDMSFRRYPLTQIYLIYEDEKTKVDSLVYLIKMQHFLGQIVIFTEIKQTIAKLEELWSLEGISAFSLYGEMTVPQRKRVLEEFKSKVFQVLVTTRSFVSVVPTASTTRLIHFDQVLNESNKLDLDVYKRRECLLSKDKKCIVICFVEKKWKDFLFKEKGDKVNERLLYNQAEIVDASDLKTYFDKKNIN